MSYRTVSRSRPLGSLGLPTVTGPPANDGVIVYQKTWEDNLVNDGFWGFQNPNAVHTGNVVNDTAVFAKGSHSGRFEIPLDTGNRQAAEMLTQAGARFAAHGTHDYFSICFRISSYDLGGLAEISQFNYQGINAAPLLLRLCNAGGVQTKAATSCVLTVYAGEHSQSHVIPYNSGRPGDPSRNVVPAGPYYVIPADTIALNTFYDVVGHVFWTTTTGAGIAEAWWRPHGTTNWTQSFSHSPASGAVFPTLQYGWNFAGTSYIDASLMAGDQYGTTDKFGCYRANASTSINVWHDCWARSTGFGAAASVFT